MSGNNDGPAHVVGKWEFLVMQEADGSIYVEWCARSGFGEDLEVDEDGRTNGPLHLAIMDAYDAIGITCPLVTDPDLLWLGGHGPNPREEGRE